MSKKRYKIEIRTNPRDDWMMHKKFSDLDRAKQSFNMCIKHVPNFFKYSGYDKFRLIDTETNEILDDSSNDTHIFYT